MKSSEKLRMVGDAVKVGRVQRGFKWTTGVEYAENVMVNARERLWTYRQVVGLSNYMRAKRPGYCLTTDTGETTNKVTF